MADKVLKINDQFRLRVDGYQNYMPEEYLTPNATDKNPDPQPDWKHIGGYYKSSRAAIKSIALKLELRSDTDRTAIEYIQGVMAECASLEAQLNDWLNNSDADLQAIDEEIKKARTNRANHQGDMKTTPGKDVMR
jgi:hypothetical protein